MLLHFALLDVRLLSTLIDFDGVFVRSSVDMHTIFHFSQTLLGHYFSSQTIVMIDILGYICIYVGVYVYVLVAL